MSKHSPLDFTSVCRLKTFLKASLTWAGLLSPVTAAEAGDAAGDDHHETDADCTHDQEQLEVDLAVLAGEPGVAVTGDLGAVEDALAVPDA